MNARQHVLSDINIYIIFISVSLGIIVFALNALGYVGFGIAPAKRAATMLFTFLYFLSSFIAINKLCVVRGGVKYVLVYVWFVASLFAFLVGLYHQNSRLYLITDLVYIVFGLMLFTVALFKYESNLNSLFESIKDKKVRKVFLSLSIVGVISVVVFGYMEALLAVSILSGAFLYLVNKDYKYTIYMMIPILLAFGQANRAFLLSMGLMLLVYFLRSRDIKHNIYIMFAFPLVLLFGYIAIILFLPDGSILEFKIQQTLEVLSGNVDLTEQRYVSLYQRYVEAMLVTEAWMSSVFTFVFGLGLGATLDASLIPDASVTNAALLATDIHNIHVLPFALIHKYGVIGLVLFLILTVYALQSFVILVFSGKQYTSPVKVWANMFYLLWFVFSLPAASFLWTNPVFWISLALRGK